MCALRDKGPPGGGVISGPTLYDRVVLRASIPTTALSEGRRMKIQLAKISECA